MKMTKLNVERIATAGPRLPRHKSILAATTPMQLEASTFDLSFAFCPAFANSGHVWMEGRRS